jgi:hypothetical protein
MMLKQFHELKHDVVTKASVRPYHDDPRLVVLSLDCAPASALLHRKPRRVTMLLTDVQANTLGALLAGSGRERHPKLGHAGRQRGLRDHHR